MIDYYINIYRYYFFPQGPRPIHWACRKGHASVVQVLLQSGVAVNAADFKGKTK